MISVRSLCAVLSLALALGCTAGEHQAITDEQPLVLPQVGAYQTRLLSPTILELTLITTKKSPIAQVSQWDFVNSKFEPRLPKPESFLVSVLNKPASVRRVGFKRRVLYAPFKQRDLRIGNYLYLELSQPVPKDAIVEVKGDKIATWPSGLRFSCTNNEFRFSPVIHVNQTGYQVDGPKTAMVGYYLGNLGEMDIEKSSSSKGESSMKIPFSLIEAASHREVFHGELQARRDSGFPYDCYQRVLEADFTK